MCGIVGIIGYHYDDLETVTISMRDSFPYRGPDDCGVWNDTSSGIGLGHRRLSIIDTSSAGHQPMFDVQQELVIVFNGEIYNYIELRQELEGKGYQFHSKTDTEVILASYREWGVHCLDRFNGMWAFAIWNTTTRRLFLARDRLGIKPLYYYRANNGTLYFASEVKAILTALKNIPAINTHLIDAYMSFGYIPGEDTLFQGIKRLMPAHYIVFDGERFDMSRYWEIAYQHQPDRGFDFYVNRAQELLENAIKLRLRSDVPLGIFLSGGLDSSTVVGLLAHSVPEQLKTFSVAYDFGSQYNETKYARMIAEQFQTDHHEFWISPQEFQEFIPNYMWLMDEPVTESAAISLYFISRLAKEHVTVVLSGEGSDEAFAGYDFYRYMLALQRVRSILGERAGKMLLRFGRSMFPGWPKLHKYLTLCSSPVEQAYKGISTYEEGYKGRLYTDNFSQFVQYQARDHIDHVLGEFFAPTRHSDTLSRMLYFDLNTWLVDDLLIKADRMSMAASLELRVPFLDHTLMEFAATIPSKYKIHGKLNKYLLKKMMEPILPSEVIYRKKMGFPTPLKLMFQGALSDYAYDILTGPSTSIHQYFQKEQIQQMLTEHVEGHRDHHRVIWQLIVLEEWHRKFVVTA